MKIIYDNIIYTLQRYGGISVVWSNLMQRILRRPDCDITALEYEGAESFNLSRQTFHIPERKLHLCGARWARIARYMNPTSSSVGHLAGEGPFIFHSSYYRTCSHKRAVNVTTVHDFTYEYFVRNPLVRFFHCNQKHRAIRHSDHIVCISENTRADLLRLLPDICPEKVSVIYNGVDQRFHKENGAECQHYALFVGNRDGYKNFIPLLKPLSECAVSLKIAGKSLTRREIRALDACGISYEYCGMVTDTELNSLYNHALCLIYPSSYEGFGLPVIEAQMAGCPVIAYNASSIPEIIGDKRLLLDTLDTESLRARITMLYDPLTRESIIKAGIKNAQRFTWENMEEAYYKLYRMLLGEHHTLTTK